jgi:hypothetical protein
MSQKKFKYPLIITGNWKSLLSDLERLGYEIENGSGTGNRKEDRKVLVTNSLGVNGILCDYETPSPDRTTVDASDRDLVLSLAAMIDDEVFHPGELVVVLHSGASYTTHTDFKYRNSYNQTAPENVLLRVVEPIGFTNEPSLHLETIDGYKNYLIGTESSSGKVVLRKATKEEILEHFAFEKFSREISNGFGKEIGKDLFDSIADRVQAAGAHNAFNTYKDFGPNIVSEKPVETTVPARIDFIKELYEGSDEEVRRDFEKEFPTLFTPPKPAPTFKLGDRIVFFPACKDLMIAGTSGGNGDTDTDAIVLVELPTGIVQSRAIDVEDTNNITEEELVEAGEEIGLDYCNYAKYSN